MLVCDHCKTEFDESKRIPTEQTVLCSVECADKLLETVVQEALNSGQSSAPARQPHAGP